MRVFFSLVIFRRFFYRWLIVVEFFERGAGGGLGTWFLRLVAGQLEVGGGTKIGTKNNRVRWDENKIRNATYQLRH